MRITSVTSIRVYVVRVMLNFEVAKPTAVDPTRLGDETLASVSGGNAGRTHAFVENTVDKDMYMMRNVRQNELIL